MLAPLFSDDMDRRLADLHAALAGEARIDVRFLAAYEHRDTKQPDRIVVDILGTPRRLVFGVDMAAAVADQLAENGLEDAAGAIRMRLPETS